MKLCSGCGQTRPFTDYSRNGRFRDGYQSRCKVCARQDTLAWRERNPERWRQSQLESEERRRIKRRANRETILGPVTRCAICGCHLINPHWDHDHGSGKPRGWLCSECNVSLGKFGDNPALLERAAAYLRERGFTVTKPIII